MKLYQGDKLITGGDWNTFLYNIIDKRGKTSELPSKQQANLHILIRFIYWLMIYRHNHTGDISTTINSSLDGSYGDRTKDPNILF